MDFMEILVGKILVNGSGFGRYTNISPITYLHCTIIRVLESVILAYSVNTWYWAIAGLKSKYLNGKNGILFSTNVL